MQQDRSNCHWHYCSCYHNRSYYLWEAQTSCFGNNCHHRYTAAAAVAGSDSALVLVGEEAMESEPVGSMLSLRSHDCSTTATQSMARDPSFSIEGYPFEWQRRSPFRFRIAQMP